MAEKHGRARGVARWALLSLVGLGLCLALWKLFGGSFIAGTVWLVILTLSGIAAWPLPNFANDDLGSGWLRTSCRWLVIAIVLNAAVRILYPELPMWDVWPTLGAFVLLVIVAPIFAD
jgi:hypothetical protein